MYENNYSNFLIGNIDEKQLPTNNDLPFVYFCGNTNGIIVSDFGEVFKTTNGGENWEKIIDFKEKIKIVKKTDDCKLFYVTESDRIFFTEGLNENIIEVKSHNINSKINDISYHENKLVILLDYNNIIRYDLTTQSFELNTFVLTYKFNQHQNIIDSPALTMDNYSEYNKFTKFLIGGISQNFESVIPNIKLLSLGVHSEHYNLFSPISISDGSLITENDSVTQIKFIDENQFVFVENGKELKYYNFNYSYSLSTKAIAEEGLGKIYRDNYLFAIPTNKGQILYKGLNENNNDENLNSLQVANISNNPLFCYAQLDNQYAIVTSTEGKFYLLGNTTTNLKEYEQYSANVYPNPTNNEVTIFVDSEISNAQIKLFDSNAKIIITDFELVDNNHIKLNTNDLANGIYYVQIQNKNSSLTLPITVSK